MTYEDLLVAIDDAAPKLPGCALRLLLRLISISIKTGSNEIQVSARSLATDLGTSRDAIRVASRALADVLHVTAPHGASSRFILPAEWFHQQRSLFSTMTAVDKNPKWPGNSASTGLETRPQVDEKPGHWWTRNQATGLEIRPQVDEKPGHWLRIINNLRMRPQSINRLMLYRLIEV